MNIKNQLLVSLGLTLSANANAMERIIVKYKPSVTQEYNLQTGKITPSALNKEMQKPLSKTQINSLSKITSHKLKELNSIANGSHVLAIDNVSSEDLKQIIVNLNADSNIQYAEVDRIMKPTDFVANDKQWYLFGTIESTVNGVNTTKGDNLYAISQLDLSQKPGQGVTVAVIDTGYTPHPDFISQLVSFGANKYGYNFISDCRMSGECSPSKSSGTNMKYKVDALDLGDYVSSSDISSGNSFFDGCQLTSSSWHGTHVMGIIAGQGYNSTTNSGVLGGASGVKILPLRALGKCGGYTSDIANAMLWAAGEANVPDNNGGFLTVNPYPADIINLSLGDTGSCSNLHQDVINTITRNGTNGRVIVVSAGNTSSDVQNYAPANCQNIISVGAKGSDNQLAFYSNWGSVDIVASGGDSRIIDGYIYSSSWSGTASFDAKLAPSHTYMQGTSMAAPNVSSTVASLIAHFKATNKKWSYGAIRSILALSSTNLDNPCYTAGKCVRTKSALDARAALDYAINEYEGALDTLTEVSTLYVGDVVTVRFKNNNAVPIIRNGVVSIGVFYNEDAFTMLQNTCQTVGVGGECEVTILVNSAYDGRIRFRDTHGLTVGAIKATSLGGGLLQQPPTSGMNVASSGGGGGGGCTMVENGDDYSLVVLILLASVYGIRRKYFTKSVK